MKRPTVVYVACPMRVGHWTDNVRTSLAAASDIRLKGYAPIVPTLSWFWDMVHPCSFDQWLEYDYAIINMCDCLVRLPGVSEGADLEMDYAVRQHKPVFNGTIDLYENMPCEVEDED